MFDLEVTELDASRQIRDLPDLNALLASRVNGGNHFMLSAAAASYPILDLMVSGDYAAMHYFSDEGSVCQAVSNLSHPPAEVVFPHSAAGDTISLPGTVLIDVATGLSCAKEFASTLMRPTLVHWSVL